MVNSCSRYHAGNKTINTEIKVLNPETPLLQMLCQKQIISEFSLLPCLSVPPMA